MNTYCLVCKKYTGNINPKVIKTKNNTKIVIELRIGKKKCFFKCLYRSP